LIEKSQKSCLSGDLLFLIKNENPKYFGLRVLVEKKNVHVDVQEIGSSPILCCLLLVKS